MAPEWHFLVYAPDALIGVGSFPVYPASNYKESRGAWLAQVLIWGQAFWVGPFLLHNDSKLEGVLAAVVLKIAVFWSFFLGGGVGSLLGNPDPVESGGVWVTHILVWPPITMIGPEHFLFYVILSIEVCTQHIGVGNCPKWDHFGGRGTLPYTSVIPWCLRIICSFLGAIFFSSCCLCVALWFPKPILALVPAVDNFFNFGIDIPSAILKFIFPHCLSGCAIDFIEDFTPSHPYLDKYSTCEYNNFLKDVLTPLSTSCVHLFNL